jgi:hypothetical protein
LSIVQAINFLKHKLLVNLTIGGEMMGVRCSCGAIVSGTSLEAEFEFFLGETITGTATYIANVCADTLELSSVSLTFIDTETGGNSFIFNSDVIISVSCLSPGEECLINVFGRGTVVNGGTFEFSVTFRDGGGLNNDFVDFFIIAGFADQVGTVTLPPGSVTALGCQ